jgi:hypothetical protein
MSEPPSPDDADLPADSGSLQDEMRQLRERNTELERIQNASTGAKIGRVSRSAVVVLLIILGAICMTVAPVAIFGRNMVLNTDRYVKILEPVAADSGVQGVIITAVNKQINEHIDLKPLLNEALPPRAATLLGPPLQNAATGLVNTVVTKFVRSDAFQALWVNTNRIAHEQLVYLLTAKTPADAAVAVNKQGVVTLDLSKIVDRVKERLVAAGLTIAKKVPSVGAVIEIANLEGVQQARKTTRALNTLANWLPWIGLALLAAAVALARRHRRALSAAALSIACGMVVIGFGLTIGRNIYLNAIPSEALPRETASFLFDTIVRYLRLGIRIVLVIALLIALGAWIAGPSGRATAIRRTAVEAPHLIAGRFQTGPVGRFVDGYASALRIGIIGFALVVLVLMTNPGLGVVISIAVIVAVLLVALEVVRATAAHPPQAQS